MGTAGRAGEDARGLGRGVVLQDLQRHDVKRAGMGGGKVDLGGAAFVMGLQEAARAETPVIARFQAGKAVFGRGVERSLPT